MLSGDAEDLLFILYFETFPEHWHGNYNPLDLLGRLPSFMHIGPCTLVVVCCLLRPFCLATPVGCETTLADSRDRIDLQSHSRDHRPQSLTLFLTLGGIDGTCSHLCHWEPSKSKCSKWACRPSADWHWCLSVVWRRLIFPVGIAAWLAYSVAWLHTDSGLRDGDEDGYIGAAEIFKGILADEGFIAFIQAVWIGDFGDYPNLFAGILGLWWAIVGGQPEDLAFERSH